MGGNNRGFTLLELLVLVAIIAMLAAILFPVFQEAREVATQKVCISNLQQLAQAVLMYASDWDGCAPGVEQPWAWWSGWALSMYPWPRNEHVAWQVMIDPYVASREIHACPNKPDWCVIGSANHANPCYFGIPVPASWDGVSVGYALNPLLQQSVDVGDMSCSWWNWAGMLAGEISPVPGFGGRNLGRLTDPARVLMLSDANNVGDNCVEKANWPNACPPNGQWLPDWTATNCWEDDTDMTGATPASARHNGGNNWIYVDGHAEWVRCGQYDCSSGAWMATDDEILGGNTMQKVHGVDQLNSNSMLLAAAGLRENAKPPPLRWRPIAQSGPVRLSSPAAGKAKTGGGG